MKDVLMWLKRAAVGVCIPLLVLIVTYMLAPDRISGATIINILQQAIPYALLGWGLAICIKIGIWDFSIGAVVLFAGIFGGNLAMQLNLGVAGVLFLCPLTGLLTGLFIGELFKALKIPSIVITIGMMLVLESISSLIFGGEGVRCSRDILLLGRFPSNVLLGIAGFIIIYYIYNYRPFGFHVRAVGNGILIAKQNGIDIDSLRVRCFMISGLYAGLYAVTQLGGAAIIRTVSNMGSMSVVFDVLICGYIAVALESQVNLIIGVYIGSVTLQTIKVAVLATGFPSMYQQIVVAMFLLLFMGSSSRGKDVKLFFKRCFGENQKIKKAVSD